MPQKSLSTFSPGQERLGDNETVAATLPAAPEKPIFRFDSTPAFTNAPFQSSLTTEVSPVSLQTSTAGVKPIEPIPTGSAALPPLQPAVTGRTAILKTRQLWEGTVTELHDGGFVAILNDKTNPSNPDEQASFDFENSEISPEDVKLVQLGSSFYWILGNERTVGGEVRNVSVVQFRRVPAWTKQKLAEAEAKAKQLTGLFTQEP